MAQSDVDRWLDIVTNLDVDPRRFEERNNELETQFIQLREDKADVVAFLKRTLQQRTDTIHVS